MLGYAAELMGPTILRRPGGGAGGLSRSEENKMSLNKGAMGREYWNELIRDLFPGIRKELLRYVDEDDADDAVGSAVVALLGYSSGRHLWTQGAVASLLRNAARQRALNQLRNRKAREARWSVVADEGKGRWHGCVAGPERCLERRNVARVVSRAIQELPQSQGEAVFAVGVRGMSCEEAASALGTTEAALRKRLVRGRRRLREVLLKRGIGCLADARRQGGRGATLVERRVSA